MSKTLAPTLEVTEGGYSVLNNIKVHVCKLELWQLDEFLTLQNTCLNHENVILKQSFLNALRATPFLPMVQVTAMQIFSYEMSANPKTNRREWCLYHSAQLRFFFFLWHLTHCGNVEWMWFGLFANLKCSSNAWYFIIFAGKFSLDILYSIPIVFIHTLNCFMIQ